MIQVVAGQAATANLQLREDQEIDVLVLTGSNNYVLIPDADDLDLSGGSFIVEAYIYAEKLSSNWNWIVSHGRSNDELDYLLGFENSRPVISVRSSGVYPIMWTLLS